MDSVSTAKIWGFCHLCMAILTTARHLKCCSSENVDSCKIFEPIILIP